ncbi:MAG: MFS transporter [Pseudomonadota bacterium]
MDASPIPPLLDERSPRFSGWRVVGVCFIAATFAWALGFYGQSVYLAELRRVHGWSAATISAATTFFYLFSAVLVVFVSDAIRVLGVRTCLIGAVLCMALATVLFGFVAAPWQLYGVYALMAVGWAGLTMAAISNTLGLWFHERRGLAISLALNGASLGGIIGVPVLVAAIGALGFTPAVVTMALVMVLVLLPVILLGVGTPPQHAPDAPAHIAVPSSRIRATALRSLSFWSIALPFALVLLAQIGFIVHQFSFMEPMIGRDQASLAMAMMTAMAVVGRVVFGFLMGRLNQRAASAVLFASQALALLTMVNVPGATALFAGSVVFGFTVGNAITLPSMIVHREFDAHAFGVVVSLSTAISSAISACGPALVGVLRDWSGSYALPLYVCMTLELVAAAGVLLRGRSGASLA